MIISKGLGPWENFGFLKVIFFQYSPEPRNEFYKGNVFKDNQMPKKAVCQDNFSLKNICF